MTDRLKKLAPLIWAAIAAGACVLVFVFWPFSPGQVSETSVEVVEIEASDKGGWLVLKDAVGEEPGPSRPFVLRLRHLRTERLPVEIAGQAEGRLLLRSHDLQSGDVLILRPTTVSVGQAVAPAAGLGEKQLIRLTLEAGMAAVMAEDLGESLRFVSMHYADDWGFNITLMGKLLKKAYKEFDEPRMALAGPPEIRMEEGQAVVRAKVRLSAVYKGRRNDLLGEEDGPNPVFLRMEKSSGSWKVSSMKGLRPLGFDEKFIRLLGADIGLPLTASERDEKKQACMPCRERIRERFGPQ